jgi:hypothetical protein
MKEVLLGARFGGFYGVVLLLLAWSFLCFLVFSVVLALLLFCVISADI